MEKEEAEVQDMTTHARRIPRSEIRSADSAASDPAAVGTDPSSGSVAAQSRHRQPDDGFPLINGIIPPIALLFLSSLGGIRPDIRRLFR